jgi:SAM-dependent methyltransferase
MKEDSNFKNKEISYLEKISNEYLAPDPGRIVDKKLVSLIVDEVLPYINGPEILEMGFGDDEWTTKIINKNGHTHIVDASGTLIKKSKEKYGDTITTYESLFEYFNPDKKFDTIIASYVLEHVDDPVQVLKKASEWLKPEGKLIAIVPHAGSLHRRLAVAMGLHEKETDLGNTDQQMGHRRVYTMDAFSEDITKAGFGIEEKLGFFTKLLPQSLMCDISDEMLRGLMVLSKKMPAEYAASITFICKLK